MATSNSTRIYTTLTDVTSSTIVHCQTQLKSSSLPTTVRDASISALSTSKVKPQSLIGQPSAKIPKRPNSTIAGGLGRASYGR